MVYLIVMKPEQLRKWRAVNVYTQARLAEVLGFEVMTVSRWERGLRKIPTFLALALKGIEHQGGK